MEKYFTQMYKFLVENIFVLQFLLSIFYGKNK